MDIKSSVKRTQGFYSPSSKTFSRQISRSYPNVLSLKVNFNLNIKSNLHLLFLVTFQSRVNIPFYIIRASQCSERLDIDLHDIVNDHLDMY